MKKIKLLTSLSSIGCVTLVTPIVATSCSNNDTSEYNVELLINALVPNLIKTNEEKSVSVTAFYKNRTTYVMDLVVSSSNPDVLKVEYTPSPEYKVFNLKGVSDGTATVNIEVTDIMGYKNKMTAPVIVIGTEGLKSTVVPNTGLTAPFEAKVSEMTWQSENPYQATFTDIESNKVVNDVVPLYELTKIIRDGKEVIDPKINFYIFAGYLLVDPNGYTPSKEKEVFELTFKVYDNYGYVTEDNAAEINVTVNLTNN